MEVLVNTELLAALLWRMVTDKRQSEKEREWAGEAPCVLSQLQSPFPRWHSTQWPGLRGP